MESHIDPFDRLIVQRYRVLKLLGRGAFGSAYLAEDVRAFGKVVVKLTNQIESDEEWQAFAREAETLARVNDPHIVQLRDFGKTEEGVGYIVRQYVEGSTLNQLIERQKPLDIEFSIRVAIAIAKGLQALHRQRIIHRDIKPSNIIVPGNPDNAMLLDFGVVGKLQSQSGLTSVGQFYGTPLYMSPEQIRADSQSPAADIYSLGATLYEMVYGKVAFPATTLPEIIRDKFSGQVSFDAIPSVPNALVSFIKRSLSVTPKDRPHSAEDVISELSEILKTYRTPFVRPAPARPSDATYRIPFDRPAPAFPPDVVYMPEAAAPKATRALMVVLILIPIILIVPLFVVWLIWGGLKGFGVLVGVLITIGGIGLASALRRWIKVRRNEVEVASTNLLLSSKARTDLSASLAIEVNNLISRVRKLDDKILATSLAIMVREFQQAEGGQMRQAAIMNVVLLLEKLTNRLSPWYVRHEKLLAAGVTAVGIVSGVTTAAASIVKLIKGQ